MTIRAILAIEQIVARGNNYVNQLSDVSLEFPKSEFEAE
jgi:hypothetical protein